MSRIANSPINVPSGVKIDLEAQNVVIQGAKGNMQHCLHDLVSIDIDNDQIRISARNQSKNAVALAGTSRSVLNNMIIGVTTGFEKKLEINGVGYRAQVQGRVLNLTLGFSHPVNYDIPEGITIQTPSPTEVVISGTDKQKVGQVAAEIRAYRPPEPYKGKGVKYADELIVRKEAKKS